VAARLPDVDALPPKQAGVDGPRAGPQDGQGRGQRAQEKAGRGISVPGYCVPSLQERDQRTGNRRPQADEQERSACHLTCRERGLPAGRSGSQDENGEGHKHTSANQPHEKQTRARPAVSESREQTPQRHPCARVTDVHLGTEPRKDRRGITLSSRYQMGSPVDACRAGGPAYAIDAGSVSSTSVPDPRSLQTVSVPLTSSARSRMPARP
jgi:hypothetical protein